MQDFRNLEVWERAHGLTLRIYRITERFPRTEMFGLASQLRRAAASVGTNLAEGCGRTQPEFARFVQIALGSASEIEYQLLLAHDLGFVAASEYQECSSEAIRIKRMLTSLLKTVQGSKGRGKSSFAAKN
jgi:four helix bundle protein